MTLSDHQQKVEEEYYLGTGRGFFINFDEHEILSVIKFCKLHGIAEDNHIIFSNKSFAKEDVEQMQYAFSKKWRDTQ